MMKKLILTVALASATCFVNAQDMMSKRGTPILPESGDWCLGFDAAPLLNYFGNLFDQTGTNSANAQWQENWTLVGKMMKDENTAYRVKFRIGTGKETTENFVVQTGSVSTPPAEVTDTRKDGYMRVALGAGLQKYRGKGRLKGYYGAEAGINLGSGKSTYDYGNAITTTTPSPESTDWSGSPYYGPYTSGPMGVRTTEEKSGSSFGFMLRGFVGAEYFFAPKMSIAAEYGWGLDMTSWGEGEETIESLNSAGTAVETRTTKTGKSSELFFDLDNASGSIVLGLYF